MCLSSTDRTRVEVEIPTSSLNFFNSMGWTGGDYGKALCRDLQAEADRIVGDAVEQKRLLEEALKS